MNPYSKSILPIVLMLSGIVGCQDPEIPVVSTANPNSQYYSRLGFASTSDTLCALIEAYAAKITWKENGSLDSSITERVIGYFFDSSYELAYGGTLTYNGSNVPDVVDSTVYMLDTTAVVINGSQNYFNVSGSGSIPSFADTVSSPTGNTYISSPIAGDTVNRTGFTITWNGVSADTAHVVLMGHASNGNSVMFEKTIPNNGSFTITSTDLNSFANGELYVGIARVNYKMKTLSNSKKSVVLIHSDHLALVHIQ